MYEELVKRLREYSAARKGEIAELTAGAAGAIEDLISALTASNEVIAKSKPRWIPVTERLPEDGSDILAVQSYCGEVRIIPANYDRGVWYDCSFDRVAEHITHWMPLPEPPKEET